MIWHYWDVKRYKFWLECHTVFLWNGEFVVNGVCGDEIYIFELSSRIDMITPLDFTLVISVGANLSVTEESQWIRRHIFQLPH